MFAFKTRKWPHPTTSPLLFSSCGLVLLLANPPPLAAESVRLYRDEWGVPHVHAETEAGATFGIGYAQAEDRLEQLLRNIREAEGTMAEAFGAKHVEEDYAHRLEQHRKVCRAKYDQLPQDIRRLLEAYQAGVKLYMARHPEQVPKWEPELQHRSGHDDARLSDPPFGLPRLHLRRRAAADQFAR